MTKIKWLLEVIFFIILQNMFKTVPMYKVIEFCLRYVINLTPDNAYKILKASDSNNLLKLIIHWLKQETISI